MSLIQPGISSTDIRATPLKPYGVTGEPLDIQGRQTISLTLGGRKYSHTFLVSTLPTEAAGLSGTDFLEATGAAIDFDHCKCSFPTPAGQLGRTVVRPRSAQCSLFSRGVKKDTALSPGKQTHRSQPPRKARRLPPRLECGS
jgi:hypothetical protein